MYCKHCGTQIDDKAYICPVCGKITAEAQTPYDNGQPQMFGPDKKSALWGILSFFAPVVALVLYAVWKDDYPKRSRSVFIGAITGFVFYVLLIVLCVVLGLIVASGYM